jgi:hypothetical protein
VLSKNFSRTNARSSGSGSAELAELVGLLVLGFESMLRTKTTL